MSVKGIVSITLLAACVSAAATIPGDAAAGAEVFKAQKCATCHSIRGEGGTSAPDLGKRTGRDFTPDQMASLVWNHAPTMWASMEQQGISKPNLSSQEAADLFAYFYSVRFFDKPGDAGRCKQVFTSKGCVSCHALTGAGVEGAPPLANWKAATDSIELARNMWNHSSRMGEALKKKGLKRPQLAAQELTDLTVYLQNLPETKNAKADYTPGSAETGKMLFEAKGCTGCHKGHLTLEAHFRGRTMADFAAGMWNHAPKMQNSHIEIRSEEMRRLVGYLWSVQYFDPAGSTRNGQRQFEQKQCASCHKDGTAGAPKLAGRAEPLNSIAMISALWSHGPAMRDRMKDKNVPWPVFKGTEMGDLIAYVNSLK